jgi:hypothetical protein
MTANTMKLGFVFGACFVAANVVAASATPSVVAPKPAASAAAAVVCTTPNCKPPVENRGVATSKAVIATWNANEAAKATVAAATAARDAAVKAAGAALTPDAKKNFDAKVVAAQAAQKVTQAASDKVNPVTFRAKATKAVKSLFTRENGFGNLALNWITAVSLTYTTAAALEVVVNAVCGESANEDDVA